MRVMWSEMLRLLFLVAFLYDLIMSNILDDNSLLEASKPPSKWATVFLVVLILGALIASMISWFDVESIVGSGPTVSVLGWVFFFLALGEAQPSSSMLGLTPTLVSLFWFLVIASLGLSPSDCEIMVPASLTVISLLMVRSGVNWYAGREG